MQRPTLDQYFMQIAHVVSGRSTCLHHRVGAVLARDGRILTTGYNGAPSNRGHCLDIGCLRDNVPSGTRHELCRAVHAEQNVIIQAGLHGVSTIGATLYCTHQPCILCAKMLVNAKIAEVVFEEAYPDESALSLLRNSGIIAHQEKFPKIPNSDEVKNAIDTLKLVMQKMRDPNTDWDDTVFCTEDMLSDTLYERLANACIALGVDNMCDCGGVGCKNCCNTGFIENGD